MQLSGEYPVSVVCEVLDIARSSFYYRRVEQDETVLRTAIEAVATRFPTYGSRRITQQLRRAPDALVVNRKHVQRLMQEMGLTARKPRRGTPRTTHSGHGYRRYPNLVEDLDVVYPNQVWVADITYIHLNTGVVIYLAVVMDLFTRMIRGWHLSPSLGQEVTLVALDKALRIAHPTIHHSDQGGQYAARAYIQRLEAVDARISMARVGEATENGYAERVIRTIKEEEVYLSDYTSLASARQQLQYYLDVVYPYQRIHSALGYLTPVEFEAQWLANSSLSTSTI